MHDRVFLNADGEMLILPDLGALRIFTEFGVLQIRPGELALIPKGIKFRVELLGPEARGFVCENYGLPFRLPELGVMGSNGLANAGDFLAPVAAFEDKDTPTQLVQKYCGNMWAMELAHCPLDVVAWRGNLTAFKYDMHRFVSLGTITVDHPDPSIYCALTSPSDSIAGPNADFMVLAPRWLVAERTFRPPGFHRNCVAEFAAILQGEKGSSGPAPPAGGAILHNNAVPHGPDVTTFESARIAGLAPQKVEDILMFILESRFPIQITEFAYQAQEAIPDPSIRWRGFVKRFPSD
jgi:homogentisate 1,2-dioxygenase